MKRSRDWDASAPQMTIAHEVHVKPRLAQLAESSASPMRIVVAVIALSHPAVLPPAPVLATLRMIVMIGSSVVLRL